MWGVWVGGGEGGSAWLSLPVTECPCVFSLPFLVCFHCLSLCFHCLSLCFHCLSLCVFTARDLPIELRQDQVDAAGVGGKRQYYGRTCNLNPGNYLLSKLKIRAALPAIIHRLTLVFSTISIAQYTRAQTQRSTKFTSGAAANNSIIKTASPPRPTSIYSN